jgi:hypothetical protein
MTPCFQKPRPRLAPSNPWLYGDGFAVLNDVWLEPGTPRYRRRVGPARLVSLHFRLTLGSMRHKSLGRFGQIGGNS